MTEPISKSAVGGRFDQHPTAIAVRFRAPRPQAQPLAYETVRQLALDAGADDAGVVPLDHPDLVGEVPFVLRALPGTRHLVALVLRMHPDDVRSPTRSVANVEFHRTAEEADEVARRVAVALSALGHRSINPAMAFPMEMDEFPNRSWIVSHKRVAVAAQLGRMGIHRSVIHPRFGSFILLATVLTTAEIEGAPEPLTFDPCLGCNLCIAACPVGAIEPDAFHFSACYDHNYREFMSGFTDLLEDVAESRDRHELRDRVSAAEGASMWQSLAYKPNYKAAYCLAVCPAGEDVLGPFLNDRAAHVREVLRPLTERTEPIYVVAGSDAQSHVEKRFPHKPVRIVRSSLRPKNAKSLFRSLPLLFQRGPAKGWRARFHFDLTGDLTGDDSVQATVEIDDGRLKVEEGLVGTPDLLVQATGKHWLEIVSQRRNPIASVLMRRLKTKGDRGLLRRFAPCFPR